MTISGIASNNPLIRSILNTSDQLTELQRQLASGQKSETYAGLGTQGGIAVGLNAQLAAIGSYNDTINNVSTRLQLMQIALGRVAAIGQTTKGALSQANYSSDTIGQTAAQAGALSSLDELLSLMNTQAGDRYLFSGSATDQPAVESLSHILDGDGTRAGLKQLISERNQADLGTSGQCQLSLSAVAGTAFSVNEAASVFGLKLASATSNLTGATVTGPTGGPATLTISLNGVNPAAGDQITVRFTLPDGGTESVTLTATTSATPGANEFSISPTVSVTAANLRMALSNAITTIGATSLTAASSIAAANDFFNADVNNPPQRVAGPPFNTATGFVAGTAANTVIWYTGEAGAGAARSTAAARIDPSLVVSYGARAKEDGIRTVISNVALLAATSYLPTDPNAAARSAALNQRLAANLAGTPGAQTVTNIQAELAASQNSVAAAQDRHQQKSAALDNYLQQITGVSNEEVGAQILTLQTRLQASLQTTAMLYKLTLVNYLP